MTARRIILSTGPVRAPDAVVIDHRNNCFWIDGVRPRTGMVGHGVSYSFRIVAALLARPGVTIPMDEMADHVWGDDPEGGPEDARNYVSSIVARADTKSLATALGGHILNQPWIGFYWQWGPRVAPIRGGGKSWQHRRKRVLTPHADTSPRGP